MKVIKVINSLDFGGIEKVFEITARYYDGDKEDIIFVSLGNGGASANLIRDLGYRLIIWNEATRIPKLRLIINLMRLFLKERPDVVHTTGAEANFHGLIAAWFTGVPVRIGEEIGLPKHGTTARYVFRLVFGLSSRVIAVAAMVKETLIRNKEAKGNQLEVIYNPVDVKAFSIARESPKDIFRIVTVSRLDPIKNLPLLFRSFAALMNEDPARERELWIVGDGPERETLGRMAEELGINGRVTFWGFQERPSTFLGSASLFVLPSFSEGLPVSAVEAMLMGTPCAATAIGGAKEFISNGESGWLLDPYDQEGFDELLKRIEGMPKAELENLGLKGKEAVGTMFSPDRYLASVFDLYKRIRNA